MRTVRLSLAVTVILVLGSMIGMVWTQPSQGTEPTETELAWATIRDGVFADRAEWEARLAEFDAQDTKRVRKLRRLVRDQLALIQELDLFDESDGARIYCLDEATSAALGASHWLEGAFTAYLGGQREEGQRRFREGKEMVREYWESRDDVDCSTAGEVAALLGAREHDSRLPLRQVHGRRIDIDYVASEDEPRFDGRAIRADGDTTYERFEWSDPLLPADLTNRMNMANFSVGWEGMVIASALRLEGPEGYWAGTGHGHFVWRWHDKSETGGAEIGHGLWVLSGHGVYEGLSAVLRTTADTAADTLTVEGTIYPGPLPGLPEPLQPASEATPADERQVPDPSPSDATSSYALDRADRADNLRVIEPDMALDYYLEAWFDLERIRETGLSTPASDHLEQRVRAGLDSLLEDRLETPADSDDRAMDFVIEPGQSVDEIEANLTEAGLLVDAEAFRWAILRDRVDQVIVPGTYTMRTTMTPRQVVDLLAGSPDP